MTLVVLLAALLGLTSSDAVSPLPACPLMEGAGEFLWWHLGPSMAKEGPPPGGTANQFLTAKEHWLRDCPRNEVVWYSILRAAELTSKEGNAPSGLIKAARAAVPNSVWIETVRARALGTVEAAEAAVRLDPKHVPAQVALAAAHEHLGDHTAAVRILRSIRELGRVVGGPLLLARAAFAVGDLKLAAASARREPDHEGPLIEPVSSILMVGEARVLEGDAWLKLGQADKAISVFHEAAFWRSLEGWKRLCSPPVELERAMEARLKKPHLAEDLRGRLLECLGTFRLRSGNVAPGVRLFVQALALPDYAPDLRPLERGGPAVREVLEKLLVDPTVPRRERMAIERILKQLRPDERAVPDPAGAE